MSGKTYKLFNKLQIWPLISTTRAATVTVDSLLLEGHKTSSGASVDFDSAMTSSAVWGCVRILSETIASLPINIKEKQGDGVIANINHILSSFIELQPNAIQTRFAFWETIVTHVLLQGNGYAKIHKNRNAKPIYVEILDPRNVTPVFSLADNIVV
jgi:HK97 family phage portal protein